MAIFSNIACIVNQTNWSMEIFNEWTKLGLFNGSSLGYPIVFKLISEKLMSVYPLI